MFVLRPPRPDEATALTALALAAKRHWGYPESWLERWRGELTVTPAHLEASLALAAEDQGRVIGFGTVTLAKETATLVHLWIEPAAHGRGAGRCLVAALAAAARERGATTLLTTADPHAEGFYTRQGFRTLRRLPADLDGAARSLPVMALPLAGAPEPH